MKQQKASKARASKKGTELHHEPIVEEVEEYTVIIHDPKCKRIIEERQMALEEKVDEPVLEEPEIQMLIEEPVVECPAEQEKSKEEYIAKYSPCNTKVLNPNSGRYVACDGPIAKKLNLLRK
jgi:hypothetical protein